MATPSLPSTNSIVDYLNAQGKDSSYSARKNLYSTSGLNLGSYTGSSSQNLALLDYLRKGSATSTPSFYEGKAPPNAFEAEKASQPSTASLFNIPSLRPFGDALNLNTKLSSGQVGGGAGGGGGGSFGGAASKPTAQEIIDNAITSAGSSQGANQSLYGATPTPTTPAAGGGSVASQLESIKATAGKIQTGIDALRASEQKDQQTQGTLGFSASTILGQYKPPSESDLINDFLNSSEGQLLLEENQLFNQTATAKAEAAKAALETKYASEKETVENNLAASGLAFSGIRGTQVKAIADALASSKLDVDRDLASKLLDADINFRKSILKGVSELLKDAQSNRKEAIQQLNAIGYAVVGDQLVPTLARENATIDDIRADANLAIAQRRLELSEQANARAAQRLAKESGGKESDFAVFLSLLSSEEYSDASDNEFLLWALQNTDLSESEANAAIDTRLPSPEAIRLEAIGYIEDNFVKKTFSSRSAELADAKKTATKFIKGISVSEFNSAEEKQALIDAIETITLDDLDI